MQQKQSNLALSLDATNKAEFLQIVDLLGPEICILKTHIDIIEDFDAELIDTLQALAARHHFLIFEDRKFADLGEVVKQQFSKGIFKISAWADIINAHGVGGPAIISALQSVARPETALLLIAELSFKGNLITPEFTTAVTQWADTHPDFVMGFIAQQRLPTQHPFIFMTPGVHLDKTGDGQDQQYRSPKEAIVRDGCDIIIVGRAIYGATDPLAEGKRYRQAGWEALKSVSKPRV